ncbi:hypothetical protein P154DRAFT_518281 [Amniculicola lignicola CBS 123094]|uniref:F-box domain-containing protein n=1 Tax=Amniculicola lignicola CBS 123094 TaxID=1392246 RepID=A0A6A5X0J7_9PLEO|nr:hypothetical protein P154DRAFT_518281 [Amniculicola lignicola CBS 123094]
MSEHRTPHLPEEILDQIIALVATSSGILPDSKSLFNICLASRLTRRIASPYLYQSIHSKSGHQGRLLQQTLKHNPALATYVKKLSIQHAAQGCFSVVNHDFLEEDYGSVIDGCEQLLISTIKLLPNLEKLDLSRLTPKTVARGTSFWVDELSQFTFTQEQGIAVNSAFANLKRMEVHLGGLDIRELWPLFHIKTLKSLGIDMRYSRSYGRPWSAFGEEWTRDTSDLESLELFCPDQDRMADVQFISNACKALKTLFVSISTFSEAEDIGIRVHPHVRSGSLASIQVVVEGLWYYDVEFLTRSPFAGPQNQFADLLTHATGSINDDTMGADGIQFSSENFKLKEIRELTEEEVMKCDKRGARRP